MARSLWIGIAVVGGGLLLYLLVSNGSASLTETGDEVSRALYLGLWGAVLAAGILGSGLRLSYVARSLALWLVVILALVASYQYRYELQDVASRISAGLIPGSPLSITDSEGRQQVVLEKLANGHFGGRISVNGVGVDAIVDTGATTTVLTAADARRAGFDTADLSYTVPVATANGMARAAQVRVDALGVGRIVRNNVPVLVAEGQALGQSLLGMNFIGTLAGFDVRGDRMILRD